VVSPDLDTFAADLTAGVADVGTVHYRGPTGPTTSPERTSCGREEEAKSLPHRPNEPDRVPLRQAPRRLPAPHQERHVAAIWPLRGADTRRHPPSRRPG
jgi:hypothetical protein